MKILNAQQIRDVDTYTTEQENLPADGLMERAATACARRIAELISNKSRVHLFCGMGNNGGDGLALARLLQENNFNCVVYVIRFRENFSEAAGLNYERLKKFKGAVITEVRSSDDLPTIDEGENNIAIEALLGTGVSGKPNNLMDASIDFINRHFTRIISIDLPGGLLPDTAQAGQKIVNSSLTLSFQLPKLAFMLPENAAFVPAFELLDIGISEQAINNASTDHFFVTAADIAPFIKKRPVFSHKGNYGHALLVAGSRGKSGAALMAAEAVLRSGAGLLTVHSTADTLKALLVRLPEAMASADEHVDMISHIAHPERYSAVAFGPGTGTSENTSLVLKKIILHGTGRLVIDADGLNILSENKTWLEFLPPGCILSPHAREFERLAGTSEDDHQRLATLRQFAMRYNCIVILKGAFTVTAMPDGNLFFNSGGNPSLAKGGSGDTLTGILLGLLAAGYNAPQAALTAVFVHGLAADLCVATMGEESVLSTDVCRHLPAAFKKLHTLRNAR